MENRGVVKHVSGISRLLRAAGLGVIATLIFVAGLGVGRGWIGIGYQRNTTDLNKSLPEQLDYSSVDSLYSLLKSTYDGELDEQKLIDGLKSGLVSAAGDPYTQYFSKDEAKEFNDELHGEFSGIGAELGKDADDNIIVVAPIDGSPAAKAGVRAQDLIISVNNESTSGMSIDKVVSKIRGEKGTEVTLKILRSKKDDMTIKIVRDSIKIPSVKWELLDNQVGYIKINQFSDDTSSLTLKAVKELKDKGASKMLLDLRGNPGGMLEAAVEVSNIWLPRGKMVVQEKQGQKVIHTEYSSGNGLLEGVKTVVLVNGGSASASEIVAGALRDNNAAKVIGEKSFGKGSVQQIEKLVGGSQVKITVARWYRPNGQNIDKKGIEPDTVIKMTDKDYENKLDPQKDAAIKYLNE